MKIAVSIGDPNGIGLETFAKAILELSDDFFSSNEIHLFGNSEVLQKYFELIDLDVVFGENHLFLNKKKIYHTNLPAKCEINFGRIEKKSGQVSYESLKFAAEAVMKKECDCLVTLPISKEAMHIAGFGFPGHTEYLAELDSKKNPLMILFNDAMRVALATIHEPIRKVPELIKENNLKNLLKAFNYSLVNDFGILIPRIAILGLNPHSGENGDIGSEENEIIIPTLQILKKEGMIIDGPFAADAFFGKHLYADYDGIFAMYHDQGLIPMKMTSVNGGVNFTAGLSFVRTSPDHGTGFDIAGLNRANPKSTLQAIHWSVKLRNS